MRILITGAGGLVGGRLTSLLTPAHQIIALCRSRKAPPGAESVSADLSDAAAVEAALRATGPEVVIHCAAASDPEICERDPERAARENVVATRTLAQACTRWNARLLFTSTDLVYPGDAPDQTETSSTGPVSVYGRSKLQAEAAALSEAPNSAIFRLALVCGRGSGSRLSSTEGIAQRLRRGEVVTLYDDEWRSPIDPESVASAIEALLLRPELSGVFNLGGPERLTRFELGERVAQLLDLDASLLRRGKREQHRGAPRPRDVSLSSSRANRELSFAPRPLAVSIREGRSDVSTSAAP
jgi:dTDP-4-dehydrorhamnose reductase